MGKRSRERKQWPKRHDDSGGRAARRPHTVRRWVCADCRQEGTLIACDDGLQRCPAHKAAFDRQQAERRELAAALARHAASPILPAGQPVKPPRVG